MSVCCFLLKLASKEFVPGYLNSRYVVHLEIRNTLLAFQILGDYRSNIVLNQSFKLYMRHSFRDVSLPNTGEGRMKQGAFESNEVIRHLEKPELLKKMLRITQGDTNRFRCVNNTKRYSGSKQHRRKPQQRIHLFDKKMFTIFTQSSKLIIDTFMKRTSKYVVCIPYLCKMTRGYSYKSPEK